MSTEHWHKSIPLNSIRLSLADNQKIFQRLAEYVNQEGERVVSRLVPPDGQDETQFEEFKRNLKSDAFKVMVTIGGRNGEALIGDDAGLFSSPNLPDVITQIYMSNIVPHQLKVGVKPAKAFELHLDFSKPPLMDSKNLASSPTPNASNLTVEGDSSWVAAITDAAMGIINNRGTRRGLIHRGFVYDFGLIVLGLPAGLYGCLKLTSFVERLFNSTHTFLVGAAYIYIFLTILWLYRIFFGYSKWAFPTVELTDSKDTATKHRKFWYAIVVGVIVAIIADLIQVPFY